MMKETQDLKRFRTECKLDEPCNNKKANNYLSMTKCVYADTSAHMFSILADVRKRKLTQP